MGKDNVKVQKSSIHDASDCRSEIELMGLEILVLHLWRLFPSMSLLSSLRLLPFKGTAMQTFLWAHHSFGQPPFSRSQFPQLEHP